MKAKRIFLLAILSGLITTAIFIVFMNQTTLNAMKETVPMVEVVTANEDIMDNQEITEDLLDLKKIPEDQLHPQVVTNIEDILHKYTSADIRQGEIVMHHRIQQDEEEAEIVAKKITEGYRAVSISVDYVSSVSNLTEPEDIVDVVLSVEGESTIESELILEEVRVLSVGQRMVEKQNEEVIEEYFSITLELSPEDSIQLINASERGTLHLVLHSKRVTEEEVEEDNDTVDGEKTEEDSVEYEDATILSLPQRSIIRSEPSLSAPILTVVDKGTVLKDQNEQETDEEGRIWFLIETPDEIDGWISGRIVKMEGE
ncbi:Flp pilus assembly protein CpaB [Salipaludibacillus sp. CF4.18]|uniref:Flp pilus assembly protein CpaB n=1 Tax=Salipaludibacillus sp. CF4.18 TaxID=3373081 RepID=UPI003EE74327